MEELSAHYWEQRYQSGDIGWDLGTISTPLKTYIDQLKDPSLSILIPGGGNAYEAEYLHRQGFKNVHVVDVSKTALDNVSKRFTEFPKDQLWHANFFDLSLELKFDLVLEQTFFCALDPKLRLDYVSQMHQLLKPKGKIVGVLFNLPLHKDRPPFGGNEEEYKRLFENKFEIDVMSPCYNSEEGRKGKELFIKLLKR
ncbi:methyltransferase domain-containing protein [Sediminibacter sp. Hel_I_10]|uniref:methyltransferase domain-containing protein n=1 Tax=Sediminibacter sp. Hel_I_10 TaxID=1392490 RepID=UPI0004798380|nr:methyltransferase domain-containing protein [Sediminibacter sp. Hel_I_10]